MASIQSRLKKLEEHASNKRREAERTPRASMDLVDDYVVFLRATDKDIIKSLSAFTLPSGFIIDEPYHELCNLVNDSYHLMLDLDPIGMLYRALLVEFVEQLAIILNITPPNRFTEPLYAQLSRGLQNKLTLSWVWQSMATWRTRFQSIYNPSIDVGKIEEYKPENPFHQRLKCTPSGAAHNIARRLNYHLIESAVELEAYGASRLVDVVEVLEAI